MRAHMEDFIAAYNLGRRLKTLRGLTPYEFICKQWTNQPKRFTQSDPSNAGTVHLAIGSGTRAYLSAALEAEGGELGLN
jgi:hypothetical protein